MQPDKDRILRLRTMPYEEYLKTPEWTRKRERALLRDGNRCRACNSNEQLEVHHRTYARRGNEDMNDLTTLCASCHEHFHERISQAHIMASTYTTPIAPKTPEERRIAWEECLIGLLLHDPDLLPYVRGLLTQADFVGKETWALYQALSDGHAIPADLLPAAERMRDETALGLPTDKEKNLARVWLDPSVQHDGKCYIPNAASWVIAQSTRRVPYDYLVCRPPVWCEEPYEIREVLSYCDTSKHRGTLYKACNFSLARTNDRGIETYVRPVRRLTHAEHAHIRALSQTDKRAIRLRTARAYQQLSWMEAGA